VVWNPNKLTTSTGVKQTVLQPPPSMRRLRTKKDLQKHTLEPTVTMTTAGAAQPHGTAHHQAQYPLRNQSRRIHHHLRRLRISV